MKLSKKILDGPHFCEYRLDGPRLGSFVSVYPHVLLILLLFTKNQNRSLFGGNYCLPLTTSCVW